jgi:hypothetical protein
MMPNTTFACGNSDSGSCNMEMSSKKKTKDCCSKDSQSKTTSITVAMENVERLYVAPSVNTAIPSAFNLKCRVLILIFSAEKAILSTISFTSAGYSSLWLIPKIG